MQGKPIGFTSLSDLGDNVVVLIPRWVELANIRVNVHQRDAAPHAVLRRRLTSQVGQTHIEATPIDPTHWFQPITARENRG